MLKRKGREKKKNYSTLYLHLHYLLLLRNLPSAVVISGAGNVKAENWNWVETQRCNLLKSNIDPKLTSGVESGKTWKMK